MAEKIIWYGVYHRDGEGLPAALFTDGDAAQTYRKTLPDPDAALVAVADGTGKNADVVEHFKATEAPAVASPDDLQETLLRNQLRSEETDRRRRERLTAEVKQELDEAEAEAARHDDKPGPHDGDADKPKDVPEHSEPSRPVARPVTAPASTQGR